nr:zinc finger, CCHC-type [Tanacetum cinerariifolium]
MMQNEVKEMEERVSRLTLEKDVSMGGEVKRLSDRVDAIARDLNKEVSRLENEEEDLASKNNNVDEVCAGGKLFNIVVDNENTAQQIIESRDLRGRVTTIPLNRIKSKHVHPQVQKAAIELVGEGNAEVALSLVGYADEVKNAMEFVFGETFVCKTNAAAEKVAFDRRVNTRSVTLEGDLFQPGGLVTGGSVRGGGDQLRQLHALGEAYSELFLHEKRLSEIEAKISALVPLHEKYNELKQQLEVKTFRLKQSQNTAEQNEHHKLSEIVKRINQELEEAKYTLTEKQAFYEECVTKVANLEISVQDHANNEDGTSTPKASSRKIIRINNEFNPTSGSNKKPKLECWKWAKLATLRGIAVVETRRITQVLVVREKGLRTNPKTKVDAIAWWIDFGSTTHVCKDRFWFKTYKPVEDRFIFYMGDDHFAHVHGKNSVVLEFSFGKSITLFNVLYVPKLRKNLISGPVLRIIHETSGSYTLQKNGVDERKNRALKEMVNSMLSYSGLSDGFWGEALLTANYLLNRSVVRLSYPKRKTLGEKGIDCIFVGYAEHSKAYRFYVIEPNDSVSINTIIESRYAIFDENRFSSIPRPKDIILNSDESQRDDHSNDVPSKTPKPRKEEDPRTYNEAMKSRDSAFSKFDGSSKGVIICLYVDDMLIFGTDQNQVDKTKKFLSSKFSINDMGEADVILEKLMPNTCKPVDQLEYSRAIGCLMYAMTSTRPDIAYAVGRLSRFTSNPSRHHWHAITKAFKYLNGTMNYSLSYVGYPSVLERYSDDSWINHVEDSSSTSGWLFLLGGGAISWASKKQTCITSSTMESEFVALAAAGKEAKWLRNLIHEIPIRPKPIASIFIHCDSAATLAKAYSQIYNGKSRHLGVRHSMIRELIMNRVISIEFFWLQHNLADRLMKALARDLVMVRVKNFFLMVLLKHCNAGARLKGPSIKARVKWAATPGQRPLRGQGAEHLAGNYLIFLLQGQGAEPLTPKLNDFHESVLRKLPYFPAKTQPTCIHTKHKVYLLAHTHLPKVFPEAVPLPTGRGVTVYISPPTYLVAPGLDELIMVFEARGEIVSDLGLIDMPLRGSGEGVRLLVEIRNIMPNPHQ